MTATQQPHNRIFLVGCARSGTTLLQSMLAAHPEILSFPESHFLVGAFKKSILNKIQRKIGLATPDLRSKLAVFFNELSRPDLLSEFPKTPHSINTHVRIFSKILDQLTVEKGRNAWVEKTPAHVFFIDLLEKNIADVQFIHIVRKGEDVVASLYEASHQFPEHWGKAYSIDHCINYWNGSLNQSILHFKKNNHCVVCFEELVADPEPVLKQIADFTGLVFDQKMVDGFESGVDDLVYSFEAWKRNNFQQLKINKGRKFDLIFSDKEKDYISGKLINNPFSKK